MSHCQGNPGAVKGGMPNVKRCGSSRGGDGVGNGKARLEEHAALVGSPGAKTRRVQEQSLGRGSPVQC